LTAADTMQSRLGGLTKRKRAAGADGRAAYAARQGADVVTCAECCYEHLCQRDAGHGEPEYRAECVGRMKAQRRAIVLDVWQQVKAQMIRSGQWGRKAA
jgi:hypothetical protein